MADRSQDRQRMVETQLAPRGIRDPRVLDAIRQVPREEFIPPELAEFAYEDGPLPIGQGQTISQPFMVAEMIQAAEIQPDDTVLDVGTGSGYAAAVLGRMARRVLSIERHPSLADAARERLRRLGYGNVEVRLGDGTEGWPDAAPFQAILAAAAPRDVPDALLRQLAVGGRLIIPVGPDGGAQTLLRITRTGDETWTREQLGTVAFVPLVSGLPAEAEAPATRLGILPGAPPKEPLPDGRLSDRVRVVADPIPDDIEAPDFAAFIDRVADARVILLGESTHGTSEFYRARAAISRRLIERHGFRIVAVEADWPDAAHIDRYVRGRPAVPDGDPPFQRFPTWMWRNAEVDAFVRWLRGYNEAFGRIEERTGFYGLDLYSLHSSIGAVLDYLGRVDPETAAVARERYSCLTRWQHAPEAYGRAALSATFPPCEEAVVTTLRDLLAKRLDYTRRDGAAFLDAERNASLVTAAERYYRAMYYGSAESWNLRDEHMFDTLCAVLDARGPDARAVVWAHNSHIGDARATEMGRMGELNIGQLCRDRFGDGAVLIGFGTDRGTVACATDWDDPMEVKQVRPARADSYEGLFRDTRRDRFLLDLRPEYGHVDVIAELRKPLLERAIGVIYRPETERVSHYFEAVLPEQFDLYLWFAETRAVTPLPGAETPARPAEDDATWPFGL